MLNSLKFICKDEKYSITKLPKNSKKKKNFASNTRSMLFSKSKKYKPTLSTASNISLHSSFNNTEYEPYNYQYLYLFNLCILRKNYKNFVALVNPELIDLHKEYKYSKPFSICLIEDKFYYIDNEEPSNFIKLLHILEERPESFILIYVQNRGNAKKEEHANIIILDTNSKKGYYFEPHGIKLYFLNQIKQNELRKLFNDEGYKLYFPNEYYYRPLYRETYGFQNMDTRDSVRLQSAKPGELDARGYCFYWCMYFINMVVKHPHLPINNLFKQLFLLIKTLGKRDFHRHIRTYAQRQEKTTKLKYPQYSKYFYLESFKDKVEYQKKMFLEYYKVFNYKYGNYKSQ